MQRLSDEYDVHVFTAAVESYANPVLDLIDPTGQYFKQRFFRSSCTIVQVRDVWLIGRPWLCSADADDMHVVIGALTGPVPQGSDGH